MTTLDRYVLREWAKVFFLATFGFPLLVFVIDLADNLEKYTSGGVSKGHLALSYVCYLPETVTLCCPSPCCSRWCSRWGRWTATLS